MKSVAVRSWSTFLLTAAIGFAVVVHVCHVRDAWASPPRRAWTFGAQTETLLQKLGYRMGFKKGAPSPSTVESSEYPQLAVAMTDVAENLMLTPEQREMIYRFLMGDPKYKSPQVNALPPLTSEQTEKNELARQQIQIITKAMQQSCAKGDAQALGEMMYREESSWGKSFQNIGMSLIGQDFKWRNQNDEIVIRGGIPEQSLTTSSSGGSDSPLASIFDLNEETNAPQIRTDADLSRLRNGIISEWNEAIYGLLTRRPEGDFLRRWTSMDWSAQVVALATLLETLPEESRARMTFYLLTALDPQAIDADTVKNVSPIAVAIVLAKLDERQLAARLEQVFCEGLKRDQFDLYRLKPPPVQPNVSPAQASLDKIVDKIVSKIRITKLNPDQVVDVYSGAINSKKVQVLAQQTPRSPEIIRVLVIVDDRQYEVAYRKPYSTGKITDVMVDWGAEDLIRVIKNALGSPSDGLSSRSVGN